MRLVLHRNVFGKKDKASFLFLTCWRQEEKYFETNKSAILKRQIMLKAEMKSKKTPLTAFPAEFSEE